MCVNDDMAAGGGVTSTSTSSLLGDSIIFPSEMYGESNRVLLIIVMRWRRIGFKMELKKANRTEEVVNLCATAANEFKNSNSSSTSDETTERANTEKID